MAPQTRSFCYVDDLVDGIIRLLLSDEHMPVNIGNPTEISSCNLRKRSTALPEIRPAWIIVADKRFGNDPQRRRPDITRARALLGWEPKVDLEEGLISTIPYFKEKLGLK